MEAVWQAIVHTPTWVWFVFGYLMFVGIKALKPQTVSVYRLMIMPTIFTGLFGYMVVTTKNIQFVAIAAMPIFLILGLIAGIALVWRQNLVFNKQQMLIHMPGSVITITLVLTIFAAKYYFGYTQATNPVFATTVLFQGLKFSVAGFCAGISLGRLGAYVYGLRGA